LAEVRGLPPGGQGGEPLVGLTGLLGGTGVHVEADCAAVDLAGPHAHQAEGRLGQTGLGCRVGRCPAESLQGIHGTGHGEDWAADPRFHGVSFPSIEPYALSDTWRRRNVTSKTRLVGGHIGTGSGVIVVVTRDWGMQMDNETGWLADRFEEHRPRLRAVAYRMLGSLTEADDAVQDAWLRVSRAETSEVENLGAWLTTIVARVALNMLRSRNTRREQPLDVHVPDPVVDPADGTDPEHEALLADSVGLALLVVLETLTPAERLAFVLHDMFAVPFEKIAPIVER